MAYSGFCLYRGGYSLWISGRVATEYNLTKIYKYKQSYTRFVFDDIEPKKTSLSTSSVSRLDP